MGEPGQRFGMGAAGLLDVLQSVRFHARRLADDHPSDWDLTRAVDALAEQVDALVETVTAGPGRAAASLSFRLAETGQQHRVSFATRGRDVIVVVDDSRVQATLALVASSYPQVTAALRQWADRSRTTTPNDHPTIAE